MNGVQALKPAQLIRPIFHERGPLHLVSLSLGKITSGEAALDGGGCSSTQDLLHVLMVFWIEHTCGKNNLWTVFFSFLSVIAVFEDLLQRLLIAQ